MDILAALKREETKFEKEMDAAQQHLDTVRAAIKLFGGTSRGGKKTGQTKKKNVMSAATKAKIAKAAKKRWAKIKAEKKAKA
ncbi:MAG: hypothetical protein WBL50_02300 [Candidatus Acidiferrum sp.]